MSGTPHSKRILKSTVAAAAAGAVVFAPLAPLAQEAGRSRDPLSISIGQSSEFTRVEFGGVIGALGVIGPTRLNYARIVPMVDYTAQLISGMLR